MPKNEPRTTDRGPWSPRTRCISSLETKAWTAPDSPKPRTSAHSVSQNMKKPSRRLSPMSPGLIQAMRWIIWPSFPPVNPTLSPLGVFLDYPSADGSVRLVHPDGHDHARGGGQPGDRPDGRGEADRVGHDARQQRPDGETAV